MFDLTLPELSHVAGGVLPVAPPAIEDIQLSSGTMQANAEADNSVKALDGNPAL